MNKRIEKYKTNALIISLSLAIVGLILYIPGFWWGAPHATDSAPFQIRSWGTDDLTPLGPLAEMYNIIDPQPNRNLGYPLMHSIVVTAAYTPYLGYLWITGAITGLSAAYPFGLANPTESLKIMTAIAHLVSVAMGVGIVVAAFFTGKTLWDRAAGVLAAIFVMLIYPMFYYSRTGNVDVPMLFFLSWSLFFFAKILMNGLNTTLGVWMGIFGGLALGTKEQAIAALLPIPFIFLFTESKKQGGWNSISTWRFWKPLVLTGIAVLIAFGLGSGLFFSPERYFAHLSFGQERMAELRAGNVIFVEFYPFTVEGNLELARTVAEYLTNSMTWAGLLMAFTGAFISFKQDRWVILFLMPILTYLAILFLSARTVQLRYLLPASYILALFAARAVIAGWRSSQSWIRLGTVVLTVWMFGVNLLHGIDLTYAMINDSRYKAAEWLGEHAEPGDRIEHFGISWSLPPIEEGVSISPAIPYLGGTVPLRLDDEAVSEIAQGWKVRQPDFIIMIPDYISTAGAPYSGATPPQIYKSLLDGSLGYRLAAYYETPPLIPWMRRPTLDYPTVNPPIRIFTPSENK